MARLRGLMGKSLALSLRNVLETLAISLPTVVDAGLGRVTKQACDERLSRWAERVVHNARIELEVRGLEHYPRDRTLVVMSNHQSFYDIPVLYSVLGGNLRMVAKKELFRVPIFSRAMREAGFIEIDRGNRERAMRSIAKAKETLASGVNVWIAPEGTRSQTGALAPFKKGGFYLAFESKLPVLPVAVDGTRHVLTAHGFRSEPGARVVVTISPPFDTASYMSRGRAGRDELMADVRAAIAAGLP